MKTKTCNLIIITLIAAGSAFFGLAGCAEMEKSNTVSLMSAAGFRARTPETAKQKEIYAALPPNRMQHATVKGKVFYLFKDEAKGIAYVGGESEYQRYKELAIKQRIARDAYLAAEMQRDAAWSWYGAWGPGRIWY